MAISRDYAVLVKPLAEHEGGGFVATVPELPGCMSDGDSVQDTIENVQGAIDSWVEEAEALGRPVPAPGSGAGQWRQRVPRSLHEALKRAAQIEGVSLNAFVTAILAESLGRRFGSGGAPVPQDHTE